MNQKPGVASSKEQILRAYQQVRDHQKAVESRIVTAEEAAERAREREVVKTASAYTVEAIVKGLADLQLNFGDTIDAAVTRLSDEASRLEALRRAIDVETGYSKHLQDIRVAADAADILEQEHREALKELEAHSRERWDALEAEIQDTHGDWKEERARHEADTQRYEEKLARDRKKSEEDFGYELARKRRLEADAFEEKKRNALRETAEEDARKTAQWAEREAALAARASETAQFKARVEAFPAELEDAVKKAREEAIRDTASEARVRAELLEKEVEGNRKVYALQIQSMEETLKKQADQIEALSAQLQSALKQGQDLALRAIEGTSTNRRAEGAAKSEERHS